jgi:Ca2+-binding RTX toxin-like protein
MLLSNIWKIRRRLQGKQSKRRARGFNQPAQVLEERAYLSASTLFANGELSIVIEDGNDSVSVGTNPNNVSLVQVLVNGLPDGSLPALQASAVERLTIIGSDTENLIDLTGVTTGAFTFVSLNGDPLQITVDSDNGDDTIIASDGFDDTIDGGDGNDVITISSGLGNLTIFGDDGNDTITGGAGNDTIDSHDGDDVVDAGAGDDSVVAGNGADSVIGNIGNDTVLAGNGTDTVDGGVGNDSLRGEDGFDSIVGGEGDDTLHGGLQNDTLDGGFGEDSIDGAAGADSVFGNFGNDTIKGGSGADSMDGGAGNDIVNGMAGADTLIGGPHDDLIYGGGGSDVLNGDAGNDRILGQSGDDTIDGGEGQDQLEGGSGEDNVFAGGVTTPDQPQISIDDVLVTETGTFLPNGSSLSLGSTEFIASADFNNDGNLDVVVSDGLAVPMGGTAADNVAIQLGNGLGGFGAPILGTADDNPTDIAVGSFNSDITNGGDTNIDFAVVNQNTDNVSIFLTDGAGNPGAAANVDVGTTPVAIAAGDFNGDGFVDLVTANRGSDDVSVLLGDGAGAFAETPFPGGGNFPTGVATGDFNGDGIDDIVVNNSGNRVVTVLINDGTGNFPTAVSTQIVNTFSFNTGRITAADYNGDGIADVGVPGFSNFTVGINNGLGGFALQQIPLNNFGTSTSAESADLDQDGDIDIAVNTGTDVTVLVNDGTGIFGLGGTIAPTSIFQISDLTIGDYNNDTLPDVMTVGFGFFGGSSVDSFTNDSQTTVDAVFNVTIAGVADSIVTVDYAVVDGTATLAEPDYVANTGTLTFDPGVTSLPITVTVLGDLLQEDNETFTVELMNATRAVIADGIGDGVIVNDDGPGRPFLTVDDVTVVAEGNTGSQIATFTVTLQNPNFLSSTSVDFTTVSGTAVAAEDFIATSGTLIFPVGFTSLPVSVVVTGDTTPEATELLRLRLSNASVGVQIGDADGVLTIIDDDGVAPVGLIGDTLNGGLGNDTLTGSRLDDILNGMAGNDSIDGGEGNDTLLGGSGMDTLQGGGGNDSLLGQGGADVLQGGLGDDIIVWRGEQDADDTFTFEEGFDTIQINGNNTDNSFAIAQSGSTLIISEGTGSLSISGDALGFAAGSEVIEVNGGRGNDTITINDINNVGFFVLRVNGDAGTDTITGAGALIGNVPVIIDGGLGDDTLTGTTGGDSIFGSEGLDTIDAQGGADTVSGGDGDDIIGGGDGNDVVNGEAGNDSVVGGLGDDLLDGGFGNDTLFGSDGNDTAIGSFGDDILNGMAGDDSLLGMLGRDSMLGGNGNDTLDGGRDDDLMVGQGGNDVLRGDHGDDTVRGGGGDDTIDAGDGADLVDAGNGADAIFGGDGDDTINGESGADTIDGHDGNDFINAGGGDDIIVGGDGDDTINGNSGQDTAGGNLGDDLVGSSEVVDDMLILSDADRAKLNAQI